MSTKTYTRPPFQFPLRLDRQLFADCTLIAGGEALRAHRVLLCACSDVFAGLLSGGAESLSLSDCDAATAAAFLDFLYSGQIALSGSDFTHITVFACHYGVRELVAVCAEHLEAVATTRTCLALLRELHACLESLPKFLSDAAALMEKLSGETDFSFMAPSEFRLLISKTRFREESVRDAVVRNYISATGEDQSLFGEFVDSNKTEALKTDYSIFRIRAPPEVGLIHDLREDIAVSASGMLSGRDPTSVIAEDPKVHWFTESDGCPWLLIDFQDIYVQPTDYAIWSHGGCSTLRNWCFQGSNDRVNWVVLSQHTDDDTIKEPFSTATWPIDTNRFFRFFRVIQTGDNWSDNNWMYMRKIEIWGVACTMENDKDDEI